MRPLLIAPLLLSLVLAGCIADGKSSEPELLGGPAASPPVAATAPPPPVRLAEPSPPALEAEPVAYRAPISCDIRTTRTPDGVLIEAIARADAPIDGEYDLVITQSSRAGASDVTQGGPFRARSGETLTLASTELGSAARLAVRLTLRDADGVLCRSAWRT